MNYVVSLFTRSPRSLRLRVFALAHALLLLPLVLSAQIVEFPYTYTVSGGKATITGFDHSYYSSHSGDLSIASELGGYPVTAIGDWVFFWHSPLTSVTIPNSVTHIGQEAFHRCPILTAVLFTGDAPDTGWHTFYDTPATVYYLPGKNGWTSSTFAGRPAVCWKPRLQFGVARLRRVQPHPQRQRQRLPYRLHRSQRKPHVPGLGHP